MYALHGLLIVAYGMKTCSKVRVLFFSVPIPLLSRRVSGAPCVAAISPRVTHPRVQTSKKP